MSLSYSRDPNIVDIESAMVIDYSVRTLRPSRNYPSPLQYRLQSVITNKTYGIRLVAEALREPPGVLPRLCRIHLDVGIDRVERFKRVCLNDIRRGSVIVSTIG